MANLDLSRAAERDLIDIYLYGVTEYGAAQAELYAAALMQKMATLAGNPSFGADYSFVQNGLRRGECTKHAIYYRETQQGILVLRILHSRMDVGRHLV